VCIQQETQRKPPEVDGDAAHGVSKGMIGKMANEEVTVAELCGEYWKHGRKGLEVYLGVQLSGKPMVTK